MDQKQLSVQIGRRFRGFRVSQGLRQKEISAVLDTTHSNISRLERGTVRRPSALFLSNCRAKLGLSIDWLISGQGPMLLEEAELKVNLPSDSRCRKGKKRRPGGLSTLAEQKRLQLKLNQLSTSLTVATRLVRELFSYATNQHV